MSQESQTQLQEAQQAAQTLADLQRKAASLPALEAEARRQERVEDALRRQMQAKQRIAQATAEALPLMQDYHQRLPKLQAEADALAVLLDETSRLLTGPYEQLAVSVAHRVMAEAGAATDPRSRAAVRFRIEEAIAEELTNIEPPPSILSPFPREPNPDAVRLVNTLLLPKCKRTVFDPSRPVK